MENKSDDLILVDEKTDYAIRAGIEAEGFSKYDTGAVGIRERFGVMGSRVFELGIEFKQSIACDQESKAYSDIDQLVYLGRKFARDLQLYVSRLLPNIRIGDKVILSTEDYEALRKAANDVSGFRLMK